MASSINQGFIALFFLCLVITSTSGTRQLLTTTSSSSSSAQYHKATATVLSGNVSVNLIWYGNFKPVQRHVITNFITSLSESNNSVATWWNSVIAKYYPLPANSLSISLGKQVILDQNYSFGPGKPLATSHLAQLAKACSQSHQVKGINVILTAADVEVEGFCKTRCGAHSWAEAKANTWIWVGNSETQCPSQCGWPCHGPKSPNLSPPNNEMGLDGMVMNLAGLLVETMTNSKGPKKGPLEYASTCPKNLRVDPATGASYNANGINASKFSVPLDDNGYNPPADGISYQPGLPPPP